MVPMYGWNKKLGSSASPSDNLRKKFKYRTGCEEPIAARNHFATSFPPKPVVLPDSQSRNECPPRLVELKRVEFKLRLGHPVARWVILRQLIPRNPDPSSGYLRTIRNCSGWWTICPPRQPFPLHKAFFRLIQAVLSLSEYSFRSGHTKCQPNL